MIKLKSLFFALVIALIHPAFAEPGSGAATVAQAQVGRAALAARDFQTALRQLEQAYRQAPAPDLLYDLGQVARSQGRTAAAADLLRRYLEEVGADVDPQRKNEIERLLTTLAGLTGEVTVAGERGALLQVDDRLVGVLPLPLPLLLPAGLHHFRLEKGPRSFSIQLTVLAGRQAELRFTLTPGMALVKLTPEVLLWLTCGGGPPGFEARVTKVVREVLKKEHALLVQPPQMKSKAPTTPRLCHDAADCPEAAEQAAQRAAAQYVLTLQVTTTEQDVRLVASMHDATVGMPAARTEARCTACSEQKVELQIAALVERLLLDATTHARGTLQVAAVDQNTRGAEVKVDGRKVGTIPVEREIFTGSHHLRVERIGYLAFNEQVEVEEGKPTRMEVQLVRVPLPSKQPGRPLRAAGWVLAGVGLAATVVGATLWGLDGGVKQTCSSRNDAVCAEELDGLNSGLPFLVPGVVVLGIGGLLLGLDSRQDRVGARVITLATF